MLLASLVAHSSYSTCLQHLFHCFRDFCLNFDFAINYLHHLKINPKIFSISLISIPPSILIIYVLLKLNRNINKISFFIFISIIYIPTLGFGLVSYLHGFNYLIYPSYSFEYNTIFILLGLFVASNLNFSASNKKSSYILIYILVGIPCYKLSAEFYRNSLNRNELNFSSNYEKKHFLDQSKFSKSLEKVDLDSSSHRDVCIFLCAENYSDYCLRTEKRSISVHFAKDNLISIPFFSNYKNIECLLYFIRTACL